MGKRGWRHTVSNCGIIFSFGFLLGCICINVLWRVQDRLFENDWTFAMERLWSYVEAVPYLPNINMIIGTLIVYGIIFLLGFWKYGKVILEGVILCFGVLLGGIETIWLLNINMKDGVLFLVSSFLRSLVVGIVIFHMMILSITMSGFKMGTNKHMVKLYTKKYFFWSLMILIFVLVYIILYSYVNL